MTLEERLINLDGTVHELLARADRNEIDITALGLKIGFKEDRTEKHDVEIEHLKLNHNGLGNLLRDLSTRIELMERRRARAEETRHSGKVYLKDLALFAKLWEMIKDIRIIGSLLGAGSLFAWVWHLVAKAVKEMK